MKNYYIKGEHYDWVTDPQLLESLFHYMRERLTVKLSRQYQRNSTILDIGCGTGRISRNFQGILIAFDINLWNLHRARYHAPHAYHFLGDAENLAIASDSVDFVLCTETLEHIPQANKLLEEVKRVLKPAGKLLLTVPTDSPIWKLRKHLTYTHPHSEPFHRNYSLKELRKLLNDFKIVEVHRTIVGLTFLIIAEKA